MFSGGMYLSQIQNITFSMLTYLTHINTILEYYHASVIIYLLF